MKELFWLLLLTGVAATSSWGQRPAKLKKCFSLPSQLSEASGLYYAGPDSLWWHNDSGDAPALYLTDSRGRLLRTVRLPQLRHVDWEDITADDQGRIYIGDFGNNGNARRDLRIYRYHPGNGRVDSLTFYYEDQREFPPPPQRANFDMEAFFWMNDSLHLFSKNRLQKGNDECKHYVLPAGDLQDTAVAHLRGSLLLRRRVITGAARSPDGRTVALVGYNFKRFLGFLPTSAASLFIFSGFPEGHFFRGRMRRRPLSFLLATQYEAVDFVDNEQLYVASEKTLFIRARAKRKRVGDGAREPVPGSREPVKKP